MELEVVQQALSMGGDGATMLLTYFLWKLERRLHNLEIFTGIKKLVEQK